MYKMNNEISRYAPDIQVQQQINNIHDDIDKFAPNIQKIPLTKTTKKQEPIGDALAFGLVRGILNPALRGANLITEGLNRLTGGTVKPEELYKFSTIDPNEVERTGYRTAGSILGNILDAVGTGGESAVSELAGIGREGTGLLENILRRGAAGATTGGLYGALVSPDAREGAISGAVTGGIGESALSGLGSAIDNITRKMDVGRDIYKLRTLSMLPKKVLKKLDIGTFINNPKLQKIYNVLRYIPLGGYSRDASEYLDRYIGKNIQKIHFDLGKDVRSGVIDKKDINNVIQKAIVKKKRLLIKDFNKIYERISDTAKQKNVLVKPTNTYETITNILTSNQYLPKNMKNILLHKRKEIENSLESEGTPFNNIWKSVKEFGRKSDSLDKTERDVYGKIRESLKDDMEDSMQNKDKSIYNELRNTNTDYRKYKIPFDDRNIVKILLGKKSNVSLNNELIKNIGKTDQVPIVEQLPHKIRDLIAYSKLSNRLSEEPREKYSRFLTDFNDTKSFNPQYMSSIFSHKPNLLNELDSLKALNEIRNGIIKKRPKDNLASLLMSHTPIAAQVVTAGLGHFSPIGTLGTILGLGLPANIIRRILRSPSLKRKFLDISEDKLPQRITQLGSSVFPILSSRLNNNTGDQQ